MARKPTPESQPESSADSQTSEVSIDELMIDPANVRLHPDRNVQVTDASLRRFGPARSIVIDDKGVVRAGNRTLESARAAGFTNVLVVDPKPGQVIAVRRKDWTASEANAYAIADNRSAELAAWDEAALTEQLRALQTEDFDLDSLGYSEGELDAMLQGMVSDLNTPTGDESSGAAADDSGGGSMNVSHVRMGYLFLNTDTFPEFTQMTDALMEVYGTENTTDTVMECLRDAYRSHFPDADPTGDNSGGDTA